ncbi:MAG: hypothetical protein ACYC46_03845 [Acidobacteriaceae bacterium]
MQTFRSAFVPLLSALLCLHAASLLAATPKTHTVVLGGIRKVSFVPPDATPSSIADDTTTLKVRPLLVDGHQKEWTTGGVHDVTDRSFVVRRAMRVNDALPTDKTEHWTWQPGPWLLVDRITGHITALHLPDFDPNISDVVWYRDYAAYCGLSATGKTLYAVVGQIGVRRAVVQKEISKWVANNHASPVCAPAQWQREPVRVTFQPTGGTAMNFEVVGTAAALVEDGDNTDQQ